MTIPTTRRVEDPAPAVGVAGAAVAPPWVPAGMSGGRLKVRAGVILPRSAVRATLRGVTALLLDDATLWGAFRQSTLPEPQWNHRSHVRVAFLHLAHWILDEAHLRMRVGIVRLNAYHGLEETPERGYHETLTRVWLVLIAQARALGLSESARGVRAGSEAFLEAHPELLNKQIALRFYSREHLMSLRARTIFVEPDLAPLPAVP
jgi:hypothetical protein